jgi:hypothetical protein
MIKLKNLLGEAEEITQESKKNYWAFILQALIGQNPDAFYRQYRHEIDTMAKALVKKYGPPSGGTIYRGIILDPSEVHNGKVQQQHCTEISYVSFSEDKRIAVAFGDTKNPMASSLMQKFPNKKGYLIAAEYRPDQLLFHHKWLSDANMWDVVRHYVGDSSKYVEVQKEVITKPKPYYYVEPIPPGASGELDIGGSV